MDLIAAQLEEDTGSLYNRMTILYRGWELLYHIEKKNIKSKRDLIVLFAHLVLIKKDILCVHEEDSQNNPIKLSELLPEGWNGDVISLSYFHEGVKLHFGVSQADTLLSLNLTNLQNITTNCVTIAIEDEVQVLYGNLSDMVPNYKTVFYKIWSDLVKPAMSEGQRDATVQTVPTPPESHFEEPVLVENPDWFNPMGPNILLNPRDVNPRGVGARDLDPLGGFGPGGGMLLENPRGFVPGPLRDFPAPEGMLPRGAVPPGARFDPINPVHPGRRVGPDADHLPMPGGGGFANMFM